MTENQRREEAKREAYRSALQPAREEGPEPAAEEGPDVTDLIAPQGIALAVDGRRTDEVHRRRQGYVPE